MKWKIALTLLVCLAGNSRIHAAEAAPGSDHSSYLEWKRAADPRFVTAIARLTACKISAPTDLSKMVPVYPPEAKQNNEQGKVVMRLKLDRDSCVRKATIVQSSNFFLLDKAALDFAMNLKFPQQAINDIKTVEDGELTFNFPIDWTLSEAAPPAPTDPCAGGAFCTDQAPPAPKPEAKGRPPKANSIWVAGYYLYDAKLGYQWTKGRWEAPRPGYHWVEPKWDHAGTKWYFIPNGWLAD